MGELEPDDSRDVTLNDGPAPDKLPHTGPREGLTRGEGRASKGGTGSEEPSETGRSWRDAERARKEDDRGPTGGRRSEDDIARGGG